ncbi:MAG: hypothetical protein DHS20C15_29310 [Planctomycetota bacterium]|nr:MAG: hypothetical protein DHS20C15_29310 [Planctomycetota bacterium]
MDGSVDSDAMSLLQRIEVLEDRTAASPPDQGFLRLRRLQLRNHYSDGSSSDPYPCDLISRRGIDAVVAVLYERDERAAGPQRLRVLLRRAIRAPIYLRHEKTFVHPDPRDYTSIDELVAGIVEPDDASGPAGLRHRAQVEALEEAGLDLPEEHFELLGGETFATPGIGDEKLYFTAAAAPLDEARQGAGDGSVMEEGAEIVFMSLAEAVAACRDGRIPDMKTEVGLLRLADHLGYLPQLDRFVDELPSELAGAFRALGLERAP